MYLQFLNRFGEGGCTQIIKVTYGNPNTLELNRPFESPGNLELDTQKQTFTIDLKSKHNSTAGE